jgi:hypothetical protein
MRISVIGHSDSTGRLLPKGTPTWPDIVRSDVSEARSEPVIVDSWRWAPYRPGAVEWAMKLLVEAEPDLVVLPLASYWCSYSTVQNHMNHALGGRAAAVYRGTERFVSRRIEGRVVPKSVSRKVARAVLRAAPVLTLPEFLDLHIELINRLGRLENIQVLVLADHHFNETNRKLMPFIPRAIEEIARTIQPVVHERRMLWGDMEQALRVGGNREGIMLPDGIHMNDEGHRRIAAMVVPVALEVAATLSVDRPIAVESVESRS